MGTQRASGFELLEMHEGIVDDEYAAAKPKWTGYRNGEDRRVAREAAG